MWMAFALQIHTRKFSRSTPPYDLIQPDKNGGNGAAERRCAWSDHTSQSNNQKYDQHTGSVTETEVAPSLHLYQPSTFSWTNMIFQPSLWVLSNSTEITFLKSQWQKVLSSDPFFVLRSLSYPLFPKKIQLVWSG